MRFLISFSVYAWSAWLLSAQFSAAQVPAAPEALDRSSQRWLPSPSAGRANASKQAMFLQHLRDLVMTESSDPSLPKLSEEQFEQMEKVFKEWRNESGNLRGLRLENIPNEWINEALADPITRLQAQRLLEQYARNLEPAARSGTPTQPETARAREGSRQVEQRTSQERKLGGRPGGRNGRLAPHPIRSEASDTGTSSLDPSDPRLPAVKELFEKLIASQQSQKDRRKRSTASGGSPEPPGGVRGRLPQSDGRRVGDESLPQKLGVNSAANSNRSDSPPRLRQAEGGRRSSRATASRTDKDPSQFSLIDSARRLFLPQPSQPSDEPRQRPTSSTSEEVKPTTAARENVTRRVAESAVDQRAGKATHNAADRQSRHSDIQAQVERLGLGKTLRRIVEKTMKEQGVEEDWRKMFAPRQTTAEVPRTGNRKRVSANGRAEARRKKGARTQKAGNQTRSKQPRTSQASRSGGEDAASNADALRHLASDIWKSIATAPSDDHRAEILQPDSSRDEVVSPSGRISWRPIVWGGLGLAVSLAAFWMLARRRARRSPESRRLEAKWVTEVLRSGMKSRADVVRAFHRFVLLKSPVAATWWTHRHVADRLSESSPQLRSAIQDLASVYVQARYLPPDVELSAEQIRKAQAAWEQCGHGRSLG